MSTDEHAIRAEIRHHGRRYGAETYPSGKTWITRDGAWLCNANWNGRALEVGDHDRQHRVEALELR